MNRFAFSFCERAVPRNVKNPIIRLGFLQLAFLPPASVRACERKRAWKGACKRAGVPGLYVHDLRRTAVSNMINGTGIPEKTAMLISGHKTRSILDRYSIVVEKDIHTAGRRMEAYLAEQEKVRTKVRTPAAGSTLPELLN